MQQTTIQKRARSILKRHLPEVELSQDDSDIGIDLRGRVSDSSFIAEVKTTNRRGIDEMEGQLAKAILQLKKYGDSDDLCMIMLHAPRVGHRALSKLENFMEEYGPEFGWGVFDDQGTVRLLVRALEVDITERGDDSPSDSRKTTHNQRAFTDLNRWLLKVVTLQDAPDGYWYDEEKYRRDIGSPAALHRVADVSQAKAYQFARTFRDLGLLKWDRGEFRIPERRRLFERWYEDEQQLRVDRFPVRSLFPGTESPTDVFADADETVDYAVGGFEACGMYDVLHTDFNEPEIHVFQNPSVICEQLDLEECADHEAELYLLQVPYEESVRRGTREVEGMKVVDILQAALDTARHAARGREQAEYIVEHVLGWS